MPIPFRPVTAADADLLRSFTMEGKCMNCDLNVANICSWQFLYHTEWAVVEGMLVLRFVLDGRVTYMKPLGRGDLRRVLRLLMANVPNTVTKETLIARVWGIESDAEDNNVEAYISFLRKKLKFVGSSAQIVTQRKVGYRLEAGE